MGLRNEQCNKVCRILDDVLANRPTERDSLITAVRKAFGALEPEPQWIPCSDKAPSEAQECWITAKDGTVCQGMFTRQYGERRDSGFICNGFGFAWLNAVAAWMPYEMPEPYREEGE